MSKPKLLMAPPKAKLVEEALAAAEGRMEAVAWAAWHSAASPYPFDYWLSQAVARKGLGGIAWNIWADQARKARIDTWAAAKWAELAKTKKGKRA